MGAPTWPPTPEEARKATLDEYGESARAVMDFEDDEDAEQALLARFLFEAPKRQLVAGEENGATLDSMFRSLQGWLRMITGMEFSMSYSDPASTDGENLFLPRAVPAPFQEAEDALLFRCMGLVQLGMIRFGMLDNRRFLAEIHTDWVLRSTFHLLASRYVIRCWSEQWPGIAKDFEAVRFLGKSGLMRVNVTTVPRKGMPKPFLPLYQGLSDFMEDVGHEGAMARRAIEAVDNATSAAAAKLVISGHAQRLREEFRRLRLGPPPLPYYLGILRPEWLLHDVAAEAVAANEWKKGNKPLRLLLRAMKKKGSSSRIPGSIRSRMRATAGPEAPPRLEELITTEIETRPDDDGSREYDEWDDERGVYKIALTRVVEVEANQGPIESYQRIVQANQPQIKEVKKRFEALRLEERWLHGQQDGTEIDLNRAVAAMADIHAGFTPKVDWYKRFQRARQSIAILTMVDLSGSTQGSIIHSEQEALVMFAEGLKMLRFPHAFYGFSNRGPRDCRFQRIKGWEEEYDETVNKRLGNLRPGGATRLGAFIRHAGWMMSSMPQGRRILILISDGKPEDRGEYRGSYGIRDTALAVGEARRLGLHIFCISMDTSEQAEDYLRRIFGPKDYLVLDRVDDLPARLPEVFRTLIK
jgi:nitric oxide reductase NorD protein